MSGDTKTITRPLLRVLQLRNSSLSAHTSRNELLFLKTPYSLFILLPVLFVLIQLPSQRWDDTINDEQFE